MEISRRAFLKLSGVTFMAAMAGDLAYPHEAGAETTQPLRRNGINPVPGICPYCSVGCGVLYYPADGKLADIEGDPDHPINRGSLCSKGESLRQLRQSDARLAKPQYRAAGSEEWRTVEWDWALDQITRRIKDTRDNNFIPAEGSITVNRTEAIASLGGAALSNEECYLVQKLMRSLGVVYLEHQARV